MAGGGKRKRLSLSKLYSFACGKTSLKGDQSQMGAPGFSRVVHCNEPDCFEAKIRRYSGNYVSTTKYNVATFLPKSLFEQFRRVANFYFLVVGILAFTPLAPYTAVSAIFPLIVVVGATMVKEGIEDWKRAQQDIEMNNRKTRVHQGDGTFKSTGWKNLRVGDIVKVKKDEYFPADLLLLSSTFEDGICYVETMNLDGETNLKLKQALEATAFMHEDSYYRDFKALIKCEDPNTNLYSFVGTLDFDQNLYPLSPQRLLLRDSKLRNTEYIYGAVIFTGHDTKVMQNSTAPPSKRSKFEKQMDKIVYFLFFVLFMMAFIGSLVFGVATDNDLDGQRMKRWYLKPDESTVYFDPKRVVLASICHFLTALMLYNYFIPISLYVSIEVVKVFQSSFINNDINLYYEPSDRPAHSRTSNLNEELGQVDTILSDKTGTLTCNSMEFIKCSVAGTAYGHGVTEAERGMAVREDESVNGWDQSKDSSTTKPHIKGFNFKDERIMDGNWVHEPHANIIEKFFLLLAICHTAIPDVDEETGKISYEAESPDEAAFVIAAREIGFEFYKRTQTSVAVREYNPKTGKKVERVYTVLNVLEFNSARKRMSVIVRNEEGKLLLLCKGADSVMFERLAKSGRGFEEETKNHVNDYADSGLRTLILAYRELDEEEYKIFNQKFTEAKNSVSADRETLIDDMAEKIERNLVLLGATAVEDKLQEGVPACIDKLAQAGIKMWVLTGDKMETAINIGFSCCLLRQGMKQIIINLENPEILSLEKTGNKDAIAKASRESVLRQITDGTALLTGPSGTAETFALIIDGKSLAYALEDDMKHLFLDLAMSCASVICCRSSPKQKALVTRLVKSGTRKTTLAIGDGANDVGMLQEADIGVGISGVEGMQAAMASDVAIAQFRYLERLLLVHGHWCYRRLSSMICYFFYKNIAFGFSIWLYEAYTSFSAQSVYSDWFLSFYNVFFTALPVAALGIFEQDVSAASCLKYPLLYQEGVKNLLFGWRRVLHWLGNGFYTALVVFFFCSTALQHQAFNPDGKTVGMDVLGGTMYTCIVWAVNLQMALTVCYFTKIQRGLIIYCLCMLYIFFLAFGSLSPSMSTTAYKLFTEALAPAASYWFTIIFVIIAALLPFYAYSAIETRFFPMYHQMIQRLESGKHEDDPEYCDMMRQKLLQPPTSVGFSARLAARANKLKRKNKNQPQ
ncbi:PREDICTED: putative phospholipid-transporting ATPase 9 [Populus euphratica]|uniref:Phospholipid-transporting ATPase n=1 Tax=Populus euphratica TaxID=75702 RepID=A0AAJ6TDS7_POPEU|nr:PREDICTED: putative phospholipid-transporting ATPase 9 [Populus euphratica]XP_011008895.1 PREDICTED: putative phospholipid-transporting ATPase 9 [Populus euphratica]